MREILFRGKRIYNGEWIEGNLIKIQNGEKSKYKIESYIYYTGNSELKQLGVKENTIGRFSGFYDSAGRKIFEGDILGYPICSLTTNGGLFLCGAVVFRPPLFYIDWKDEGFGKELSSNSKFLEIIGNIYDNPELLSEYY